MENALIARFLLETYDNERYTTEAEIIALKGNASEVVGKLLRELPEWDIFNPDDE